jgi:hypothetical protein
MQSVVIAMLMPEGSSGAALLVRRADGQFSFERIDARVACAARAAAKWLRKDATAALHGAAAHIGSKCL